MGAEDEKLHELIAKLTKLHGGFKVTSGFYNGHYHKNAAGLYQADTYPIPVISVMGLCDLEIDLADVDYVSSSGLRVFVSASKLAMLHGGSFSLLHPRDDVMDVLEVTGMADVFTVIR